MVLLSIVVWEQELVSEERSQLSSHHLSLPLHPCASPSAGMKCPCLWQQCLWGKEGVLLSLLCLWGSTLVGCSLPGSSPAKLPSAAVGARGWHTSGSLGPKPRWRLSWCFWLCCSHHEALLSTSPYFLPGKDFFQSVHTVKTVCKWSKGFRKGKKRTKQIKWWRGWLFPSKIHKYATWIGLATGY